METMNADKNTSVLAFLGRSFYERIHQGIGTEGEKRRKNDYGYEMATRGSERQDEGLRRNLVVDV